MLARRRGIKPQTVARQNRSSVTDLPTSPKQPSSTVLSIQEEAIVIALRSHLFAAERLHGDDTMVPVLAKGKTITAGMSLCARCSPLRRPGAAGDGLLLLAQSKR